MRCAWSSPLPNQPVLAGYHRLAEVDQHPFPGLGCLPACHQMLETIASIIMPRTTVNLDASVLRELKRRAAAEGKSLGDVISEMVAPALARRDGRAASPRLRWHSAPMGPPRVDLEDKEAVRKALGNR